MSNETQQHTLRAMAKNYAGVHYWDHLDSQVCVKAADEIAALEAECERLRARVSELHSEVSAANERAGVAGDNRRFMQLERDALAAELAAIRAAGGAQVEVVAYQCGESGRLFSANFSLSKPEPLMRISQHGRIVAAMAAELEQARRTAEYWKQEHLAGNAVIEQLRAELEAARKQSPIGHVALGSHTGVVFYSHMPQLPDGTKLYALPPLAGQVSGQECRLGILGKAYDTPSVCRAYTYADQPDNVGAMKLGRAALSVRPGGDEIDAGLGLLDRLSREGYGVFQIAAIPGQEGSDV